MKFMLPIIALLLAACSKPEPAAIEVPTYQTLHPKTSKGAFFHFNHEGKLYLACSIHQGNSAPNTEIVRNGSNDTAILGKEIHHQKDLRVLEFKSDHLGPSDALPYHSDSTAKIGDTVVILNRGQKIPGTVVRAPTGQDHRYFLKTKTPFAADGMSGSPVFSERLGTVIGVLQTADSKTSATLGGFELLRMP